MTEKEKAAKAAVVAAYPRAHARRAKGVPCLSWYIERGDVMYKTLSNPCRTEGAAWVRAWKKIRAAGK